MRRRLLTNVNKPLKQYKDYFRSPRTQTWTVPDGCTSVDIFLVGGGGGGGAWYTWGCTGGVPGTGGNATTQKGIAVSPGQVINISIGAGGAHATDDTLEIKSAKNGGDTTVTINGTTYKATGGKGGYNGADVNDDDYLFSNFGIYQSSGGYYNGNVYYDTYHDNGDMLYPDGSYFGDISRGYMYMGIPEFFESGGLLHAAPGIMTNKNLQIRTDFPIENSGINSSDNFTCYSGGGYGGGGFGGMYRNNVTSYGGNGSDGVVVIRYKAY